MGGDWQTFQTTRSDGQIKAKGKSEAAELHLITKRTLSAVIKSWLPLTFTFYLFTFAFTTRGELIDDEALPENHSCSCQESVGAGLHQGSQVSPRF